MKEKLTIIKVGGKIVEEESTLNQLLADFSAIEGYKLLVYGGLVNKNIVAGLQAKGVNAIGLTGADMNVIRSVKRPVKDVDYGFVGDVEKVNAGFLATLIRQGIVPVMAPLTHDGKGAC